MPAMCFSRANIWQLTVSSLGLHPFYSHNNINIDIVYIYIYIYIYGRLSCGDIELVCVMLKKYIGPILFICKPRGNRPTSGSPYGEVVRFCRLSGKIILLFVNIIKIVHEDSCMVVSFYLVL